MKPLDFEFETAEMSLQDYTLYMLDMIRAEVAKEGVIDVEIDQTLGPVVYTLRISMPAKRLQFPTTVEQK